MGFTVRGVLWQLSRAKGANQIGRQEAGYPRLNLSNSCMINTLFFYLVCLLVEISVLSKNGFSGTLHKTGKVSIVSKNKYTPR